MLLTVVTWSVPPRVLHYSDLETAHDTPARAARVAGCLRERGGPDALVAGSGDNTGPGVLSLVSQSRQALDFFEAVQPDVDTVGNHDFDHGVETTLDVVEASPQAWVLANAERDGSPLGRDRGLERWTTRTVSGTTVGVTGVVDPATSEMTPGLDVAFLDPVESVETAVEALRREGAAVTVVLAHTTASTAERVARLAGVDAVLAGHSHDPWLGRVDDTPLSRPGATGRWVFELDLSSGATRRHDPADFPADERVRRALEARARSAGVDEVVAEVAGRLSRDRERRRAGEWRLGNFVADAYRWATGADVALQNTGGIRDGPPLSGEVTRGELVGLSPFEEPVVVAELTGEQLVSVAHEADGRRLPDLPDYWMGHVSGMTISQNGNGFDVRVAGSAVDPDERYTLATPRFVLVTDREFPTLRAGMTLRSTDRQYEVIVRYAREVGVDPPLEGRIPRFDRAGTRQGQAPTG